MCYKSSNFMFIQTKW